MSLRNTVLFLSLLLPYCAYGFQKEDSLKHRISVNHGTLISSGKEAPFWLVANNSQRITNEPNSIWSGVFARKILEKKRNWDWGYGLEVLGRFDEQWSIDIVQGYLSAKNKYFNLHIGRKEELLGVVDSTLSIGTLVNGNNALPIPKVAIRTNGWINVPFTEGWVQFNAYYSHGWFEKDRFIQNALLHQKYLYLNVGAKWLINAYGGIVFNTQWGGRRSDNGEKQPSSFKDYLRVITGTAGGQSASSSDQQNALGNHLGTWEIGATADLKKWRLMQYWQFIWEDRSGLTPFNWRDGLMGVSVKRKNQNHWFTGANLEIVRTNDQNAQKTGKDGVPFLEPNDYFENSQYRSGWTYNNSVIGNPIFLSQDVPNSTTNRIASLVNAVNIGVEGKLKDGDFSYQLQYIYFKNQGRYTERFDSPFNSSTLLSKLNFKINGSTEVRSQLSIQKIRSDKSSTSIGLQLQYYKRIF